MIQLITLWLFTGGIGGREVLVGTFSIVRSTLPALRATILKEFVNYLHELGLYTYVLHNKTDRTFTFQGREIVFFSLDDEHKLRGRAHTFIWFNEVTDITFEAWNQGVMRTSEQVYNDYNPSGAPFIKEEIEDKRAQLPDSDVYIDVSVYTDNPFLPELMVKEIEGLKNIDKDLWKIYSTGQWVSLKGLIYPSFEILDTIPLVGRSYFGVDFGWNDPTVFVKVNLDKDCLYIDTLIYERELLIEDLARKIKEFVRHSDIVWCDSAEPRTIEELRRKGVNAKAAKKGRDSIRQGIGFIRQHNIYISSGSVDTINEFKMYKWEQDKEGRLTDKPIDFANHSSDACRYAINRAIGSKLRLI